jgi:hypothetical protein
MSPWELVSRSPWVKAAGRSPWAVAEAAEVVAEACR